MNFISRSHWFPFLSLIIGALVAAVSTPASADRAKASIAMRALDQVLGEDLFRSTGLTFSRMVEHRNHIRTFAYSSPEEETKNPLAIITISVAAAGRFIEPMKDGDGDASTAGAKASNDRSPSIGAITIDRGTVVSPDAVVSEIWFRTADNLFDVKVVVFEASSNVAHAELSAVSMAETVALAYHNTMK